MEKQPRALENEKYEHEQDEEYSKQQI